MFSFYRLQIYFTRTHVDTDTLVHMYSSPQLKSNRHRVFFVVFFSCFVSFRPSGRQGHVLERECGLRDHAVARRRLRAHHLRGRDRLLGRRHQQVPVDGAHRGRRASQRHQGERETENTSLIKALPLPPSLPLSLPPSLSPSLPAIKKCGFHKSQTCDFDIDSRRLRRKVAHGSLLSRLISELDFVISVSPFLSERR